MDSPVPRTSRPKMGEMILLALTIGHQQNQHLRDRVVQATVPSRACDSLRDASQKGTLIAELDTQSQRLDCSDSKPREARMRNRIASVTVLIALALAALPSNASATAITFNSDTPADNLTTRNAWLAAIGI